MQERKEKHRVFFSSPGDPLGSHVHQSSPRPFSKKRTGTFWQFPNKQRYTTLDKATENVSLAKANQLSNHLGNVRVVVSDRKLLEDRNKDGEPEARAEVLASYNYYPFGMQQPGRVYEGSAEYRFGFNGKEKDNSLGSTVYDYGFRIYNPQIGKFLSVDPLTSFYPWYTHI